MKVRGARRTSAGFTVLELAIGVVLLLVLSGAVLQTLDSMKRMALVGNVQAQAQREAQRSLELIVEDLRRSGQVTLDGLAYPHFIVEGTPAAGFDEDEVHLHLPANKTAVEGDLDFGPDVGILFVHPALWPDDILSLDPEQAQRWPHGRPVLTTDDAVYGAGEAIEPSDPNFLVELDGRVVWNVANTISYTLRTDLTGTNTLVRREANGAQRVMARNVERVVFENSEATGFSIPLNAVRVRLFFRLPDNNGQIHRFQVEATVRLRNSTGV